MESMVINFDKKIISDLEKFVLACVKEDVYKRQGLIRVEWKKIFLPVLFTTILLSIVMSVLSCTLYRNYSLHYDLEAWEVGTEFLSLLFPLFTVVPLCWNLYYEGKDNFLLYVMPRVPIKSYLMAKWLA